MNEILKDVITDIKKKEIKKEFINALLNAYYDYVYSISDEEFYAVYNGIDEEEDDEIYYPEELTFTIEQRESGIYEAIEWVIEQGYDVNEGESERPLMIAVNCDDPFMTKYLINHGADATVWPYMDELPMHMRSNWYYDDIDIEYFEADGTYTKEHIQAMLDTAKVLATDGKLGGYHGLCLKVDEEASYITIGPAVWKF